MLIYFKPSFKVFAEFTVLINFEKKELSSAKILHIDIIPSGKSFMYIKNKSGPNIDTCDTPEFIFLQYVVWPFPQNSLFLISKITF